MNKEQLHRYISESTGNESNICQIYDNIFSAPAVELLRKDLKPLPVGNTDKPSGSLIAIYSSKVMYTYCVKTASLVEVITILQI